MLGRGPVAGARRGAVINQSLESSVVIVCVISLRVWKSCHRKLHQFSFERWLAFLVRREPTHAGFMACIVQPIAS